MIYQALLSDAPLVNTIYTVTGVNSQGCEQVKTVNANVTSVPLTVTPSTAICIGGSITLVASGANTYTWSNFAQGPTNPVNPVSTQDFSVTATGAANCKTTAVVTITVNPNPTITAVPSRSIMCKNESNTITAFGASTYTWSNTTQGPSITINPVGVSTQNFTVNGIDINGCKGSAFTSVKVNSCSDITEFQSQALMTLFPNPGSGMTTVLLPEAAPGQFIEVYNNLGGLVARQVAIQGENKIVLSDSAAGLYHVVLMDGKRPLSTGRLILQK